MNSYCLKTSLPALINYSYSNASKTDFYAKIKLISFHSLWTVFLCDKILFLYVYWLWISRKNARRITFNILQKMLQNNLLILVLQEVSVSFLHLYKRQIKPKMEYCHKIWAGASQSSDISFEGVNSSLMDNDIFSSLQIFSHRFNVMRLSYLHIFMANVQRISILHFHKLRPLQLRYATPLSDGLIVLISSVFQV